MVKRERSRAKDSLHQPTRPASGSLVLSHELKGPSPKTHLVALTEPEGRCEPLLVLRGTWSQGSITPVTARSPRYPFSSAESSPKRNTLLTLAAKSHRRSGITLLPKIVCRVIAEAEYSTDLRLPSHRRSGILGLLPRAQSTQNFRFKAMGNDPSAGSPTETLLRLLLPLDSLVRAISVKASSVARLPLNLQSPH